MRFELISASFKIKIGLLMAAWSKHVWSVIQLSKYGIADGDSFSIPVQKEDPVWHLANFLTALLMFAFFGFLAFLNSHSLRCSRVPDSFFFM